VNGNKFVLDTNTVINYLNNQISLSEFEDAELFISVITELELFAKPAMPSEEEDKIVNFLKENVFIVELDPGIKKETIGLRRSTKIKLPDCIVAATSIVLGATLLTHDTDDLLPLIYPGYQARDIS
jgi:predicted nucleic acid-binding protein